MNNGMRKALPARPSQDLAYGGSPAINGAQFGGRNAYENRPVEGPNGASILDGYRNEIMNGFEGKPRFNPVSTCSFPVNRVSSPSRQLQSVCRVNSSGQTRCWLQDSTGCHYLNCS